MTPWLIALWVIGFVGSAGAKPSQSGEWTSLLDEDLNQWEIFMGVPHGSVGLPGVPADSDGKVGEPLGLNKDPLHVFTVRTIEGEPVLNISGEMYGGLTTREVFADYHLRVQFRWGTRKFAPRLNAVRDNGILYHCYGPHGTFWNVWKNSLECQVQEQDIGDFYGLGGLAYIQSEPIRTADGPSKFGRYVPGAPLVRTRGRCARGEDYHERPHGEWNTIEIIAVGDRSLHLLNGRVVNVLQDTFHVVEGVERMLVSGQIQIQSEGAEAEYRRIEIRSLSKIPSDYEGLFIEAPASEEPRPR